MRKNVILDGEYRYSLTREWDNTKEKIVFVMLNPSTADGENNDPTTDKCEGFARRWGYGSLEIVNLFAFRSKKPTDLKKLTAINAIGPENYNHLKRAIQAAEKIVIGWGENGVIHNCSKNPYLLMLLDDYKDKVYCFGKTANGQPLHPLYLSYDKPLQLEKIK